MSLLAWSEGIMGLLIFVGVIVSLNSTHRFCQWCGHTLPAEHDHDRCNECLR